MEKQPDDELGTEIGRCPNFLRYQEDTEEISVFSK